MKLAFKNRFSAGYKYREVPVKLSIGTLEAVCDMLKIDFWQIGKTIKDKDYDFLVALLYQGYLTACKEAYIRSGKSSYPTPEYRLLHAAIWYEYLNQESQREFVGMMQALLGKLKKGDKKKVKADPVE